jgi:hypothetical protein
MPINLRFFIADGHIIQFAMASEGDSPTLSRQSRLCFDFPETGPSGTNLTSTISCLLHCNLVFCLFYDAPPIPLVRKAMLKDDKGPKL